MTAPAVTGIAVHFPLEWAELPLPRGLMACVCTGGSVSKCRHAGILTRCTSNTVYFKIQEYKQLYTSKLAAASVTDVMYHYMFSHYGLKWSNCWILLRALGGQFRGTMTWLHRCTRCTELFECSAVPFVSCPKKRRKKCCWCLCWYVIDGSLLWPGQAFTLS